jgi:hypothetical protein
MDGILWTDITGGTAGYEVPKGSGKTSVYAGGIWIGGTDVNGQLKLTGVRFKGDRNYWPGPLIMSGEQRGTTDVEVCYQYDRHYQITRYQVEAFREWYNTPPADRDFEFKGYSIPQIILDWPAHADAAGGYDFYLAPSGITTTTVYTTRLTETTRSTISTVSFPAEPPANCAALACTVTERHGGYITTVETSIKPRTAKPSGWKFEDRDSSSPRTMP